MHGSENVFHENTQEIFIRLECAFIRRNSGKVSHKTDGFFVHRKNLQHLSFS